jgi:hypothetical protein
MPPVKQVVPSLKHSQEARHMPEGSSFQDLSAAFVGLTPWRPSIFSNRTSHPESLTSALAYTSNFRISD